IWSTASAGGGLASSQLKGTMAIGRALALPLMISICNWAWASGAASNPIISSRIFFMLLITVVNEFKVYFPGKHFFITTIGQCVYPFHRSHYGPAGGFIAVAAAGNRSRDHLTARYLHNLEDTPQTRPCGGRA